MAQQRASGFERPLRLVSLLWLHLVLSALFVSFPPHHAKAMGVGTLGWCTPLGFGTTGCFPTAAAACEAQWQHYEPTRVFFGYTDGPRWFIKHCQWSVALGVIHPAPVDFRCSPGYERLPSGLCVLATEFYQQRKPPRQKENPTLQRNACNAAGGNINNGGSANPTTPNAIEITSGSKFFSAEDYRTADDSIVLERIYTSLSYGGADFFWKDTLGLGTNWRFSFQHEIHIHWNFEYIPFVQLQTAQGGSFGFRKNGSGGLDPDVPDYGIIQTDYRLEFVGTWPPNSGVLNTVTQWKMRDPDDRVWLFESFYDPANNNYGIAHPISVTFPGGLQWTFTYGPYQELVSIADSYGKSVSFEWLYRDPSSVGALLPPVPTAVSKVTLPDTTTLNYTYDSASGTTVPGLDFADRLLKVEHKDAASNVLDATSYVYGNSDFPWHVTKIQDADGTDRWFVEYDTSGRAIVSRGPDDADKYAVAYGTIASNAFTRTVTNALGKQTVYNFAHGFQNVRLDSIAGVASANCPASTQTFAYQSGFIRTVTDAEGRATRFSRNTAGQPTTIIDGWGTASARTTTLTWHTTFRVPTQIAQPLLTTDLTWNASRQLTQVTQTDTTTHSVPYSTNGQTRTWSYSYDTFGRLLTVDGPLAGSGDTVTYTYDSDGFLASITNEVGHVLTVSTVDANGYPTSVVDENGVTIGLTYDSERRLKTVTVDPGGANAVTTLDYDVVGQITRITRPNGAFLEYTWDDGKRLTKVEDNTGGSIEYDRNDFGNITARRVKNAGGTILLSQTATFDELGRLLTFVGAASQTWTSAYDKTDRLVSVTDSFASSARPTRKTRRSI